MPTIATKRPDYGISEAERRRLVRRHGREGVQDVDWLTVEEFAHALLLNLDDAREYIRGFAELGYLVEGIDPAGLASDHNVTTRTLRNWEERGLPAVGANQSKRYVSPIAFQWIEQFQRQTYHPGRSGRRRFQLSASAVARDMLGYPPL
jgi:hypothetical protein